MTPRPTILSDGSSSDPPIRATFFASTMLRRYVVAVWELELANEVSVSKASAAPIDFYWRRGEKSG